MPSITTRIIPNPHTDPRKKIHGKITIQIPIEHFQPFRTNAINDNIINKRISRRKRIIPMFQ